MPGTGTGAGAVATAEQAPALCLDLTRLLRRIGRGPLTGIDRAERAWLDRLIDHPRPAFGLIRTSLGFLLLDRCGMQALAAWVEGGAPPPGRDPLRLLRRLRQPGIPGAEAAVAAVALDRCLRPGLARLLKRNLPAGTHYLNTGHSNLRWRALAAWRSLPGAKIAVLVHDTIPLDLPETQRQGTAAGFRARLAAVAAHADLVIHVSAAARAATEAHLARLGRVPPGIVAPNGIRAPAPDPSALPPSLPPPHPYFVALGTIEPRKDHALLLDIWDRFETAGGPVPRLLIVGRRGWAGTALLARLDAMMARRDPPVREIAGLPDPAVAALLSGARALLMPSRAEGCGLPVIEAMALGTPVLATNLAVYRETAGDYPVYLPAGDLYSWSAAIMTMAEAAAGQTASGRRQAPRWTDHFNLVLRRTW